MPLAQIIIFRRYLEKNQKLYKFVGVPISSTDRILFFVFQMYASKYFTEEDMMKYKMIQTTDKDDLTKTLA